MFTQYVSLDTELESIAWKSCNKQDVAHDARHGLQVKKYAIKIAESVHADVLVAGTAGLFHDIIVYRKDDPRSLSAADDAALATMGLLELTSFPEKKILPVVTAIREHSYSRGSQPSTLESAVVQDADRLESLGAIGVMRVAALSGYMQKPLYCLDDPFCDNRQPGGRSAQLDLFYSRFLTIPNKMHTAVGKELALQRVEFMQSFLDQLRMELK
ncbi:MAG: HD domain-containing protein [Nanoarchaeota archaeon]|nr:HD domain-containing protein [Nanoarchaeota archaeon]